MVIIENKKFCVPVKYVPSLEKFSIIGYWNEVAKDFMTSWDTFKFIYSTSKALNETLCVSEYKIKNCYSVWYIGVTKLKVVMLTMQKNKLLIYKGKASNQLLSKLKSPAKEVNYN